MADDPTRPALPTGDPEAEVAGFEPPHPGVAEMPRWDPGLLVDAPVWTRRSWMLLLGPALISGGSAIAGGEWLMGPAVTARYGGAMMWLATLSILGQVLYNCEISRYTLYTGEPIFTGKFRTKPGPSAWALVYLLLDFGAVFPYAAANAATPVAAMMLGRIPGDGDAGLVRGLGIGIFLLAAIPMVVGGRIYRTLQGVMAFKIVAVLGFLGFLAVCFGTWQTAWEIVTGFVRFGEMPVKGSGTENVLVSLFSGRGMPDVDLSTISLLAAFAAIAGNGGLTNTPLSNYTRDQGWGMGRWVGAIPSLIGGRSIKLSHVGRVFRVSDESLPRWKRWYRHVARDQLVVWMPACFVGVALPSVLSIQFLPRGTTANDWALAAMTADGVRDHVAAAWGAGWGRNMWYGTLACGLLVLGTTVITNVDGFVRRWVDVFWTASPKLRDLPPESIKYVYFAVLALYVGFGVVMLSLNKPLALVKIATNIMNFALAVSCWHTVYVNTSLLPRELRPNAAARAGMVLAGCFFFSLATVTALKAVGWIA